MDRSLISEWWSCLDKWLLSAIVLLACLGVMLIGTASPPVAERINYDFYYFLKKHILFMFPSALAIIVLSAMSLRYLRLFSLFMFCVSVGALILTFMVGEEIKGARRWLDIGVFTVQPSEFIKPSFAVVGAWLCSWQRNEERPIFGRLGGYTVSFCLGLLVLVLLLLQPDWGQSLLFVATGICLAILAGVPLLWCLFSVMVPGVLLLIGYISVPHVRFRIDSFFEGTGNYQVEKSLEAFRNGGFFGTGPAEGSVKNHLPDSHTDFIFAVAAEEFGVIFCGVLIAIFVFIFVRVIWRVTRQNNHFVIFAAATLVVQLAGQAFVNIASTLNLTPTTGMTLPLISYGGSSLLAVSVTFGLLLGFTRRAMNYSH